MRWSELTDTRPGPDQEDSVFSHLIIQHKSQPVLPRPGLSLSVAGTLRTGEHINDLPPRHHMAAGAAVGLLHHRQPRLVVVEVRPAPGEAGPGDAEVGVGGDPD